MRGRQRDEAPAQMRAVESPINRALARKDVRADAAAAACCRAPQRAERRCRWQRRSYAFYACVNSRHEPPYAAKMRVTTT